MTGTNNAGSILVALLLCALMGALGQGVRAVVGLKNSGSLASTTPSAQSQFSAAYFGVSMMIGAIAGVLAGIMLGLKDLVELNADDLKVLIGIAGAGYVGADFVENAASLVIPASPAPVPTVPISAPVSQVPIPAVPPASISPTDQGSAMLSAALRIVCPKVNEGVWVPALITGFAKFGLSSNRRVAAAIGQFLVEAGPAFQELVENLNYSPEQAARIFHGVFSTPADAELFVGNQEAFGNHVYANRNGNGNEASGDGFRFRGRGLIQLTGRTEYTEFGRTLNKTAEDAARYCETTEGAAMSACWYLSSRGCLPFADKWDIDEVTKLVNGSAMVGAAQRRTYSDDMLKHLGGASV
jgi:predicted chitinase